MFSIKNDQKSWKILLYNPKTVFDRANDRLTTLVDNEFERWKTEI